MRTTVKSFVKKMPIIAPVLAFARKERFKNSADYWDRRYRNGGNSGPGSYNRLAEFKANFLNNFVSEQKIESVIEFGSGDGSQLKLAQYPSYLGVDVSSKAIEICRNTFAGDISKRFAVADAIDPGITADLSLSLDVVFHLVEDSVFEAYMNRLFESAKRFVIVYSSNKAEDRPAKHVRHRQFTTWVELNKPEWLLRQTVPNACPYDPTDPDQTSFADFYVFARRT